MRAWWWRWPRCSAPSTLLFRLIRRSSRANLGNGECIGVLGSRSLGGGRNLHLVQVGGGVYLVGATDQALNLIAQVTDQDDLDALTLNHSQAVGTGRRFADLLADVGAPAGAAPVTASAAASRPGGRRRGLAAADFLQHQRERLQRLRRRPHPGEAGAAN